MQAFDLSSKDYVNNPYPVYQLLHQHAPVYFCEEREFYYVSRYEHVKALFRDARASSNRIKPMANSLPEALQTYAEPLISCLEKWLLFLDAPKHTQLRRVINPAFTVQVVEGLKPRIAQIAEQLIDGLTHKSDVDLIADFAYPLPVMVIAEMLACPVEDRDLLKKWSDDIASFLGNKTTLESASQARSSIMDASSYFAEVLKRQRLHPVNNLLQNLIDHQQSQPDFTDQHLIANCIALIFAGHETTTNLIGNAAYHLYQRLELLAKCQSDDFLNACIEEVLRYDSPVQRIGRFSQADIEIGNMVIPEGHRILLMIGAANRDAEVFDQPDVFFPERGKNQHLAFGFGHHLCSGANVARTEALIALRSLFLHTQYSLKDGFEAEWQYNLGLRALTRLPLSV